MQGYSEQQLVDTPEHQLIAPNEQQLADAPEQQLAAPDEPHVNIPTEIVQMIFSYTPVETRAVSRTAYAWAMAEVARRRRIHIPRGYCQSCADDLWCGQIQRMGDAEKIQALQRGYHVNRSESLHPIGTQNDEVDYATESTTSHHYPNHTLICKSISGYNTYMLSHGHYHIEASELNIIVLSTGEGVRIIWLNYHLGKPGQRVSAYIRNCILPASPMGLIDTGMVGTVGYLYNQGCIYCSTCLVPPDSSLQEMVLQFGPKYTPLEIEQLPLAACFEMLAGWIEEFYEKD